MQRSRGTTLVPAYAGASVERAGANCIQAEARIGALASG